MTAADPGGGDGRLIDDLLALALALATEAGALAHDGRPDIVEVADTKSSATDIVTAMDRAVERLLVERILAARPDDAILGEEGGGHAGGSGVRWVLDPIDGTVNYLYGAPSWAVSIGVELHGAAVVGVVEAPARGERYVGVRGRGARLISAAGERALHANRQVPLDRALVGTGFGYTVARREVQARAVSAVIPVVRDIRRDGSCALDLCAVATGRLDGYYELGPQPWDHSAGALIATEAGAVVDLVPLPAQSDPLIVAAGPGLIDPLRRLVVPLH